ncbi:MAG: M14 family zinc carboxypeptidase [Bacteroidales bacterium]
MKRFLLLTAFAVFFISGFAQQEKYSRIKVYANEMQVMELAQAGIDVTEGTLKFGKFIICDYSETEIAKIENLDLLYEVLIEDVAQHYVDQNIGKSKNVDDYKGVSGWTVPENFEFGSMSGHATWSEVVEYLDNMVSMFPDLITAKESLGQTIEGRDIWMVKISDNPGVNEPEPEVLYTALHHAREPAGLMTVLYYMWYLLENYDSDPFIQALVDNTEMYFIPVINVDGYVYNEAIEPNGGGMWRKNRRDNSGTSCMGVDPNRNYGYMWGLDDIGSSPDPCEETYRGESAFSEPEIQALRDFIEAHEFKNTLNYHTHGNLLLYAWGYTEEPCEDDALFHAHSLLYTADNNYTFGAGSLAIYPTNGGSDDWMYGEQTTKPKILAYTPELGGGNDGFWCAIDRIIPIAQENMIQNILAAALCGNYYDVAETSPTIFEELSWSLTFEIKRLGLAEGGAITALVQPLSDNIQAVGDFLYFDDMELLEAETGSISFSLESGTPSGSVVEFLVSVDNGDYVLQDTITKIFGTTISLFTDDGNTLNNWVSPSWDVTTSSYVSPPGSITDSPNGEYQNNQTNGVILTEEIDLTELTYAQLSFNAKWEIEQGWDYVQLQISSNGGSSWEALEGKYTVIGNSNQAVGQPLYDGFQTEWVLEEIELMDYIGEVVIFRFLLKSDTYVTEDGFYFDDFTVLGVELATTGLNNPVSKSDLQISNPMPNPVKDVVSFHVSGISSDEHILFNMYNMSGQIVYSEMIENGNSIIKIQVSEWNRGVYYYQVEGKAGKSESKKLIVL